MDCKFVEFKASQIKDGMQYFYFNLINGGEKEYSVIIKVLNNEVISTSCSCVFGSYFKYSKKNLKEKKDCYHVNNAIEVLKLMKYVEIKETGNNSKPAIVTGKQIGRAHV